MIEGKMIRRRLLQHELLYAEERRKFDWRHASRLNPVSRDGKYKTTYAEIITNGVYNHLTNRNKQIIVAVRPIPDLILFPYLEEDREITLLLLGGSDA